MLMDARIVRAMRVFRSSDASAAGRYSLRLLRHLFTLATSQKANFRIGFWPRFSQHGERTQNGACVGWCLCPSESERDGVGSSMYAQKLI